MSLWRWLDRYWPMSLANDISMWCLWPLDLSFSCPRSACLHVACEQIVIPIGVRSSLMAFRWSTLLFVLSLSTAFSARVVSQDYAACTGSKFVGRAIQVIPSSWAVDGFRLSYSQCFSVDFEEATKESCNLMADMYKGINQRTFVKCQYVSLVHPANKSLTFTGCVTSLSLYDNFKKLLDYRPDECDPETPAVQEIQKAREECKETLCAYAKSGEWYGYLPWSKKKGKQLPWGRDGIVSFTNGWYEQFEKSCSSLLVKAHDTHFVKVEREKVEYQGYRESFFDKTQCGCKSRDLCDWANAMNGGRNRIWKKKGCDASQQKHVKTHWSCWFFYKNIDAEMTHSDDRCFVFHL